MSTRKNAFDFFFLKILPGSKMLLFQELCYVTTRFRDCHFDVSVSSNVRYVACSNGTDCHAESPSRVQCLKMAKIDPVSPFYPTLWLEKEILQGENLQEVQKYESLGCNWISTFVRFEIRSVYTITAALPWKYLNFDGVLRRLHSITQANSQVCFKWMSKCVI